MHRKRKRKVIVFDFDGTLTTRDTFVSFSYFVCGKWKTLITFLLHMHWLLLMVLHIVSHEKTKQKIFSSLFKGMRYANFKNYGMLFAQKIMPTLLNKKVVSLFEEYTERGNRVYVITASIEEWVKPWCIDHGVTYVLGTQIEVDDEGIITGRFKTRNCYGQEKVNRLLEIEPRRKDYYLCAYGDSRGDKEMLAFADEGHLISKNK